MVIMSQSQFSLIKASSSISLVISWSSSSFLHWNFCKVCASSIILCFSKTLLTSCSPFSIASSGNHSTYQFIHHFAASMPVPGSHLVWAGQRWTHSIQTRMRGIGLLETLPQSSLNFCCARHSCMPRPGESLAGTGHLWQFRIDNEPFWGNNYHFLYTDLNQILK